MIPPKKIELGLNRDRCIKSLGCGFIGNPVIPNKSLSIVHANVFKPRTALGWIRLEVCIIPGCPVNADDKSDVRLDEPEVSV